MTGSICSPTIRVSHVSGRTEFTLPMWLRLLHVFVVCNRCKHYYSVPRKAATDQMLENIEGNSRMRIFTCFSAKFDEDLRVAENSVENRPKFSILNQLK